MVFVCDHETLFIIHKFVILSNYVYEVFDVSLDLNCMILPV